MDLEPDFLQELLVAFQMELEEQLTTICEGLLQIERQPDESALRKILDGMFRAAHNIKGAARGLDITSLSEIAHHLENLLSRFKRDSDIPAAELIDLVLETVDHMRADMSAFVAGKPQPDGRRGLVERLNQAAGAPTPAPAPAKHTAIPEQLVAALPRLHDDRRQPEQEILPQAVQAEDKSGIIRVRSDDVDAVTALVEEIQVTKIELDAQAELMRDLHSRIEQLSKIWLVSKPARRADESEAIPDELRQIVTAGGAAVADLNELTENLQQVFHHSTRHLGALLEELQRHIRLLRLVPAATLLPVLSRSVRDIARELNKKVKLETTGEDTLIDRVVLTLLRDPLIHLLRNAVDHGIEPPAARRRNGKPEAGRVALSIRREGNQVIFQVEDDGSGIDVEKIVDIAVRENLISAVEARDLTREHVLDFLFRPGFSTTEIITNISGRGVGLDVARTNIGAIKGSVHVDTEPERGSRFTLRVPLTLATDHGLLVRCGASVFAIPIISVDCVFRISPIDIVHVAAGEAVLRHGRAIPLRSMRKALQLPGADDETICHVVMIHNGWRSVALLVDEVVAEQEIVIKPLMAPLTAVRNIAGATFTGSGEVVLVLDPPVLVESALRFGRVSRKRDSRETEAAAPRILIVDDSLTTRMLEKNILENHGYRVTVAVNGEEGWEILQKDHFDLVVTDIDMPIMTGFEFTERIRQHDEYRQMPVVIVTSLSRDEDKQRGIEVGADAYLVKSRFETRALLDVVDRLV